MATPVLGEIWNADLNPTRGREQAGRRPVLVVSTDRFNQSPADLVVVAPITSKRKGVAWHVTVDAGGATGLRTESFIMVEAVRCISHERLNKRLGNVSTVVLGEVEQRLRFLLDL